MVDEDESERASMQDVMDYVGIKEQAKPMADVNIKRNSWNHTFTMDQMPAYFNGA